MPRRQPTLLALLQSYFQEHLRRVRGASEHTVRSYRDGLRLFLAFAAERLGRSIADLDLDDLRADLALAFLDHLEAARRNDAVTRNCRRAAIRGFVEHVLRHDPTRAEQYRRVLALPAKRVRVRPPGYLEPEEARLVLAQPDATTVAGARDRALLLLLYNTGARISEALGVCLQDISFDRPRQVRLRGKGGKDRICPLWPETAVAIRELLDRSPAPTGPIFRSSRGGGLSRDGAAYLLARSVRSAALTLPSLRQRRVTPHVLRHSCAVALLQAGVDLTVIRDYLGHVSVATTGRYVTSNLQMKRKVLEAFWKRAGLDGEHATRRWRPKDSVLAFLSSL